MSKLAVCALALVALVAVANADLYMHNMRGSNNRLNEQSANRDNGDRLFDSQNNNRGGYNVGDKTKDPFPTNSGPTAADTGVAATYNFAEQTTPMQYQMVFYEGSVIQLEWTNQHACGGNDQNDPQKINCNMVFQYMCDTDNTKVTDPALQVVLRDGITTNTPQAPTKIDDTTAIANNMDDGHHESEAYYYECSVRSRNRGLFHADQNQNGNSALFTRQNNNGNQRGLECTEERDYYPYWAPVPWIDFAYMTDDLTRCPYILAASQNTATTYKCTSQTQTDASLYPIQQAECIATKAPQGQTPANGQWVAYPGKGLPPTNCVASEWSRDNHLGNGRFGQPLQYNWTIPLISTLQAATGTHLLAYGANSDMYKCVIRFRYNISTDDYNPWSINSSYDDSQQYGVVSPIQENPTVDVGADLQGLRLAINTAQFGRTFQDRSHVFYIKGRPAYAPLGTNILNLNVRGKRGNIVQTYPSVEYDFIPNRAYWSQSDFIHIQWTGSNTHNNGNDGGDGQTGDAGEGTEGTDRHNFVQMLDQSDNYPMPLDKVLPGVTNLFEYIKCWDFSGAAFTGTASSTAQSNAGLPAVQIDCAVALATSLQFRTAAQVSPSNWEFQLDNAPASLVGGVLVQITPPPSAFQGGQVQFNYMCSRNNNFSNRSHKGALIITQ